MTNVVSLDYSEYTNEFIESLSYDLFLLSDRVKDILEKVTFTDCFHYTLWKEEGAAIHFRNAVIPNHPLKGKEFSRRKQELENIARDLNFSHSYLEYVFSLSWM